MSSKKRKVRVEFQKNRVKRSRRNDLTREHQAGEHHPDEAAAGERMSGKGDLTRRRTVIVDEDAARQRQQLVESEGCHFGRVLTAIGLASIVESDDRERFECSVRRVVRTVSRDARNAVVTGDRVLIRPNGHRAESGIPQAVVEWVQPRHGVVSRAHNNREHILAANVDQALIVASAGEPPLKPSLIDRFLLSCEKGSVTPLICINKVDLVRGEELEPLVIRYGQLGYETLLTSAIEARGIGQLTERLRNRTTVLTGQSGVGKSSLLNAIDANLDLRTGGVSNWSMKGKHTTRRAEMLPLSGGGFVIDTPGIRQFQIWEVEPGEVEELFVEFIRYVPQCRFANCTHTHEEGCAVKRAVELGMISTERYDSYRRIFEGIEE